MPPSETIVVHAPQPGAPANGFRGDLVSGLSARPRSIPCKHLYDKRGSELFDRICTLPEYYLTRCELEIMRRHAGEMARRLGGSVRLVELGSGSSRKTRLLLEHLGRDSIYLPVDVSREHLEQSARALARDYPHLRVLPVCGDFSRPLLLPQHGTDELPTAVYFPGSTIGNF
ncbi:MAG: L-histidine N(alpha)-methyltransferase, partial [Planctomycetales bacterium]|nr:L-histidine N(alpha)-methyltransferase [Planctomycetales bacterium]